MLNPNIIKKKSNKLLIILNLKENKAKVDDVYPCPKFANLPKVEVDRQSCK